MPPPKVGAPPKAGHAPKPVVRSTIVEAATKPIDRLGFSPPVAKALRGIQAEVAEAYRERFIEMTETMRQQASTLARIQETLHILVQALQPQLAATLGGQKVPVAMRIAAAGELPDLASAVIVADPIGAGYMLSQTDLAKALGLPPTGTSVADVGVLLKAFKLREDGDCAVRVRSGSRSSIVNYHPRAIDRFRELLADPPAGLTGNDKSALERVRRKLAPGPVSSGGT